MKHLIEDFTKLGGSVLSAASSMTGTGRLCTSIKVCRPHWSDALCRSAACELRAQGLRGMGEFSQFSAWIAYLNAQLAAYARQRGVESSRGEADEVGQQRWEQRWQRYRLHKFAELTARGRNEANAQVLRFPNVA